MDTIKELLVTDKTKESVARISATAGKAGTGCFSLISSVLVNVAISCGGALLGAMIVAPFTVQGRAVAAALFFVLSMIYLLRRTSKNRVKAGEQAEIARKNAPQSESSYDKFNNTTTVTSNSPQRGFRLVRVIDHKEKEDTLFCLYTNSSTRGEQLGENGVIEWLVDGKPLAINLIRVSSDTDVQTSRNLLGRSYNRALRHKFGSSMATDILSANTNKRTETTTETGAAQLEVETLRTIALGSDISVRVLGQEITGSAKDEFVLMFAGFYRDNFKKN